VTRDEHLAVLRLYDDKFAKWEPEQCPKDHAAPVGMGRGVKHARWMMQEMMERIEKDNESSPGQADRWVGFIQGVLWVHGLYSISDMAAHNVPPQAGGGS
jgi:hypothetical protein